MLISTQETRITALQSTLLKRCSDKESATSADQILWDRWNILGMEIILRPRIIQLAT